MLVNNWYHPKGPGRFSKLRTKQLTTQALKVKEWVISLHQKWTSILTSFFGEENTQTQIILATGWSFTFLSYIHLGERLPTISKVYYPHSILPGWGHVLLVPMITRPPGKIADQGILDWCISTIRSMENHLSYNKNIYSILFHSIILVGL